MTNEQRKIIERTIGGIKIANSRKAITDDYAELFINDLQQALNIADVVGRSEQFYCTCSRAKGLDHDEEGTPYCISCQKEVQ